nr:DUF4012 domain-containing protein [Gordonia soli]
MRRTRTPSADGRHWGGRRLLGWGIAVFLVAVLLVLGAWIIFSAQKVRDDVSVAQHNAGVVRSAPFDADSARVAATKAVDAAKRANARSHDPVWTAGSLIPWVGDPLDSIRQMTDVVEKLSEEVLVPSSATAGSIRPQSLIRGDVIDIGALAGSRKQLDALATRSSELAKKAGQIDGSWSTTVSGARDRLVAAVQDASSTFRSADLAARLLPPMLGATGPRNYFLALQTPSEARATGGLLGGFATVEANEGRVTTPLLGRNIDLRNPPSPQVELGSDFDDLYGWTKPYTDFRNNNISPSFPDAAKIWIANWRAQTGQNLDGAIALDPIALSYVLEVTGPTRLPGGEVIDAKNVVPITLSTSYQRFAGDNGLRKTYLQVIARSAIDKIRTSDADPAQLLKALGRGLHERRIMVYSNDVDEQKLLESTGLGHQVPDTAAPYADVAVQNVAGNKIDYYLRREISYSAGECRGASRQSIVKIRLVNTLDDLTLPPYVIGSLGARQANLPPGTSLTSVQLTATRNATLKQMTVDGRAPLYYEGNLHGHPAVVTQVRIPPGGAVTVEFVLDEPTSAKGAALVPVQPLVDQPTPLVDVPECGE